MQMDTGSEVTLIPRNFWGSIRKPTLRKRSLLLSQFDGSVMKTLVYLEGFLELEDKFEVISIIVTTFEKNHGLLGNDVRHKFYQINYEIKMEKNEKIKKKTIKRVENFKKCYPFLLWGTKIASTFVAISSRKITKINRIGPSWTCSLWG